jgi:hypothetical protein
LRVETSSFGLANGLVLETMEKERRFRIESLRGQGYATYHAHALAKDPNQGLVIDGLWARNEEVCDGEVEQRDGGDNSRGRDERHGEACGPEAELSAPRCYVVGAAQAGLS